MSHQAVTAALRGELARQAVTNTAPAFVLVVLGEYAGPDGTGAFPSVATIAAETRLSPRGVQKALRQLEQAGLIARDGSGPRGVTRWKVNLTGTPELSSPPHSVHPEQDAPRGRTQFTPPPNSVHPTPELSSPEPPENHQGTTREPPTTLAPAAPGPVQRVFDAWRDATGRTDRTVLDASRRRTIATALKTFDEDDLIAAVRNWRLSPFHRGENDRTTVYNDLRHLIGDAAKVERFRDLTAPADADGIAQSEPGAEGVAAYVRRPNAAHGNGLRRGKESHAQRVARLRAEAEAYDRASVVDSGAADVSNDPDGTRRERGAA